MRREAAQFSVFFLVAALASTVPGCKQVPGSGSAKSESRALAGFTDLDISGAFSVDVSVGKEHSVQLAGDDNLLPLVLTEVQGSRLKVSIKESYSSRDTLKLTVSMPELTLIKLSGAVALKATGIANDSLRLELSGASKVTLAGKTGRFEVEGSGATQIVAGDLAADAVMLRLSGAGKAEINAATSLQARLSGASHVRYRGTPKELNQEVSGASSLEPMK